MKHSILILLFCFSAVLSFAQRTSINPKTVLRAPAGADSVLISDGDGHWEYRSKDFTDQQQLSFDGNIISLTRGGSVDVSDLAGGGGSLNLSNANMTQDAESRTYDISDTTLNFTNFKSIEFSNNTTDNSEPFLVNYRDTGNIISRFGNTNHYILRSQLTLDDGSANTNRIGALLGQTEVLASNNDDHSDLVASYGNLKYTGSGVLSLGRASYSVFANNGDGKVSSGYGHYIGFSQTGTDTVNNGRGVTVSLTGAGRMNSFKAFEFPTTSASDLGTLTFLANDNANARSYTQGNMILGSSYGEGDTKLIVRDDTNDPVKIIGLQVLASPDSIVSITNDGFLKKTPYSSGSTSTYTNGVTNISGSGGLGGSLTQATSINTAGFDLQFTGTGNVGVNIAPGSTKFRVEGATNNIATYFRSNSTSTANYLVNTGTGNAALVQNVSSGPGLDIDVKSGLPIDVLYREGNSSSLNTLTDYRLLTTGTASDGFGGSIDFVLEKPDGGTADASRIAFSWDDAANTVSRTSFYTRDGGVGNTEHLALIGAPASGIKNAEITGNLYASDTLDIGATARVRTLPSDNTLSSFVVADVLGFFHKMEKQALIDTIIANIDLSSTSIAGGAKQAVGDFIHNWKGFQLRFDSIDLLQFNTVSTTRNGILQLDDQMIFSLDSRSNAEKATLQATSDRLIQMGLKDISFQAGFQVQFDGTKYYPFIFNDDETIPLDGSIVQVDSGAIMRNHPTPYKLPKTAPSEKNQILYTTSTSEVEFGRGIPWITMTPGTIASDERKVIGTTGGTYTLPASPNNGDYVVLKTVASSTIDGFGSDTIDGSLTLSTSANTCVRLEFSGGEWTIVARYN